jgi:hypothetical protein
VCPESRQHVVKRGTAPGIVRGACQHERQVAQVGLGRFKRFEPGDAHHGGHRVIPAGHHEVRAPLGVRDEPGHGPLSRLRDAQLVRIPHNCLAVTMQVTAQIGQLPVSQQLQDGAITWFRWQAVRNTQW